MNELAHWAIGFGSGIALCLFLAVIVAVFHRERPADVQPELDEPGYDYSLHEPDYVEEQAR